MITTRIHLFPFEKKTLLTESGSCGNSNSANFLTDFLEETS